MSWKAPLTAPCPACDADVRFRKAPYLGQYKICADCDTELEVVSLAPVVVNYLEEELDAYEEAYDEFEDVDEEDEYAEYAAVEPEPERRPVAQNETFELDN